MSQRLLVLGLLLGTLTASAQRAGALEGKKVAVLEFSDPSQLAKGLLETLSDQARGGVVEATRSEGVLVLTRENMLEVLKTTGGKCEEGQCEVETARNLQVEYFVTGGLAGEPGALFLTLKAYDTRKGAMLGQRLLEAKSPTELVKQLRPVAVELVNEAFGLGKARPASAKAQPTVQLGSFGEAGKDVAVEEGEEVVVKFESEPAGATVSVDGELLCQSTPCSKRIASGRHEVLFQKERYAAARLNGIASKGALVRGTLQPKFGWLTIETDVPGISVSVDGSEAGKTPVNAREVDEGAVEVAVSDGCYVRTGERIAIKAGERRTLRLVAKPKLAGLKVNAVDEQGNDLEATVRVDGREVGEAGATLKVPVCSKEVSVKLGSREWREELKLEEGKVTVLTAKPGRARSMSVVQPAAGARVKLEGKRVAVLEFKNATKRELSSLVAMADEARGGAAALLSPQGAIVRTRESMLEMLRETSGSCVEGKCEVEMALNLRVDYFVTGTLNEVDGALLLTLKLFDSRTGELKQQQSLEAERELVLLKLVRASTTNLLVSGFGLGGRAQGGLSGAEGR